VGLYRAQGVADAVRPALVGSPPAVVTPYWTEPGNLALDVGQSTRRTAIALTPDLGESSVQTSRQRLTFSLNLPLQLAKPAPASLRLTRKGPHPATVGGEAGLTPARLGTATLQVGFGTSRVGAGMWRLDLGLVDGGPWIPLGVVLVRHRWRPSVLAPRADPADPTPSAATMWMLRRAGDARHVLRPWARAGVRRLPPRLRRPVKGLAHRVGRVLH
jgi:hypothetical protein